MSSRTAWVRPLIIAALALLLAAPAAFALAVTGPVVTFTPLSLQQTQPVTVTGRGFSGGASSVTVELVDLSGRRVQALGSAPVSGGSFTASFTVPGSVTPDAYGVRATSDASALDPLRSGTSVELLTVTACDTAPVCLTNAGDPAGDRPLAVEAVRSGAFDVVVSGVAFESDFSAPSISGAFSVRLPAGSRIDAAWLYVGDWGTTGRTLTARVGGGAAVAQSAFAMDPDDDGDPAFELGAWRWDVGGALHEEAFRGSAATVEVPFTIEGVSRAFGAALVVVYELDTPGLANRVWIADGADSMSSGASALAFANVADGTGTLTVFTQADNPGGTDERVTFNGADVLAGDTFNANLGLFASLHVVTVDTDAGTNTASATTRGDWLGLHLVVLSAPPEVLATTTTAHPQVTTFTSAASTVRLRASVATNAGTHVVDRGQVTFSVTDGSTTIGVPTTASVEGGEAEVTYQLPAGTRAGTYSIDAAYSGGPGFGGSTGTATLTVEKASTTTTARDATATFGDEQVELLATVTSDGGIPSGAVTFALLNGDGSPLRERLSAELDATGAASVSVPLADVHAGTYRIVAAYEGSADHAGSTAAERTLEIRKRPTTTETADVTALIGQTVRVSARVTGSVVNEGTVTFTVTLPCDAASPTCTEPEQLGSFTAAVEDGVATTEIALTSPPLSRQLRTGSYAITARYDGADHATSDDLATLAVRSGVVGTASCGGEVQPNATVRFYSGTTPVLTLVTAADGTFTAFLEPATYTFTFETDGLVCGGGKVTITGNGGTPAITDQVVDLKNHSWRTAYTVTPEPGFTPFCEGAKIATVIEHKFKPDQSLWFRFRAGKGSVVQVTVRSGGTPIDAAFYRDIAKLASAPPPSSSRDLLAIGAEAADGDFADGDFADGDFADGDFADGDFADGDFADGDFADGDFADGDFADGDFADGDFADPDLADGDFADGDFADGDFADGDFAPDQLSPGEALFGDENSNLLKRARFGVSARAGLSPERLTKILWGDDEYVYVKVFGDGVNVIDPVELSVVVCPGSCEGTTEPTGPEGGWTVLHRSATRPDGTIVVTDLAEQLQVVDLQTALAHPDAQRFLDSVKAFLDRPEVGGTLIDVGTMPRVASAKQQAKARIGCAWANNVWMREVKKAVDAHRTPSLAYVVLVGDGGVIPFEQFYDRAGLAPAGRYLPRPPFLPTTIDRGALENDMFLSQDRYGSRLDLKVGDFTVPVLDVAVGRVLGERARSAGETEGLNVARGLFEAYSTTTAGVVPTQGRRAGVASYGRQDDGAQEVARILERSMGAGNVDKLRHPGGPSEGWNFKTNAPCAIGTTDCTAPWDADTFRGFMNAPRWFNVVGVHGRDSSALMADYRSRSFASELLASPVDMSNTLHLWLACNVGRSVGNAYAIDPLTLRPDYAETFARKRAVLIAPTSYTYFETELASEYQERWNIEFAKALTSGSTSWGNAFVAAKREYLVKTAQMSGMHEKQVLELVYFGLPHLRSDLPAVPASSPASIVEAADLTTSGALQRAEERVAFTLSEQPSVLFRDAETGESLPPPARYWAGEDGFSTDRTMPVLPLQAENVSHPQRVPLRGVALREGTFSRQDGVRIKTSAALFELMTVHSTFRSSVLYPIVPWRTSYYDELARADGGTLALFTPLQYVTDSADGQTGQLRLFQDMSVRLYYSGDLAGALLSAPAVMDVTSRVTNADDRTVEFIVRINSAAKMHEAWLTRFDVNGTTIRPIDLAFDAVRGVWTATHTFGAGTALGNVRYGVWAVDEHGAVGRDLNNGAYYVPGVKIATATEPKSSTAISIVSVTPEAGTYRTEATVVGRLTTADGAPISGEAIELGIGPARATATTGPDGTATAKLKLLMTPATYFASASFRETARYLGSTDERTYTVAKRATVLTIESGVVCGAGYAAILREAGAGGHALDQEAILFEVASAATGEVVYRTFELTRHDGRAFLSNIPLAPGTYTVRAYFAGTMPIGGGQTIVVHHSRYQPSVSTPAELLLAPRTVSIAFSGQTAQPAGVPVRLTTTVTSNVDTSLLRDVLVRYTLTADGKVVHAVTAARGTASDWAALTEGLPLGVYGLTARMIGECTTSGVIETLIARTDPNAGHATAGGSIASPAGAYPRDPSLTGTADFSLNLKYETGAATPSGTTKLDFKPAQLAFESTRNEWLVVSGGRVHVKGKGRINGAGAYDFVVSAVDGLLAGGPDRFRIRIWDTATGAVVYDNEPSATLDATSTTPITSGSVVVHKK